MIYALFFAIAGLALAAAIRWETGLIDRRGRTFLAKFPATDDDLSQCLDRLREDPLFEAMSPGQQHAAELVLDELVTNVIKYGTPESGAAEISAEVRLDTDALRITLSDTGNPFDPLARATPDLDGGVGEREIGGLGIHLLKNTMDEFSYQHLGGRNIVRLAKRP
jgi:anti-sigma regulatory factor (Ser/Thr protein kinase)